MNIEEITDKITPILQANGASYAGVFGSVARGEELPGSDVDLVVAFKKNLGLFKFVGVKLHLEKILHKPVDLVSYKAIKSNIKPNIIRDLKDIYGERPQI